MAKQKSSFYCNSCGHQTVKWLGRCPGCGSWNSFVEELLDARTKKSNNNINIAQPQNLQDISIKESSRFSSGFVEIDNLLGGGIVAGSVVLIGGEPGIGKSTILLQLAASASTKQGKVLYVSAEESLSQIKLRAERVGVTADNIFIIAGGEIETILDTIEQLQPALTIVDSIQTVYAEQLTSSPGSLGQVRECTNKLIEITKKNGTAMFLTGHVTKEGALAGPKTLEHMVDTVLYFEGKRDRETRIIRSVKNRFGSVNEIGVFLMQQNGLQEVQDPTGIFLSSLELGGPGACLTAALEGNRVLLAEIQALVTEGVFNNISRTIDGMEANRVLRIKAVIDKRLGIQISGKDVFVNVTGGLNIYEPAVDLPVALAMISSFKNKTITKNAIFLGELSLLGDIRRIEQPEKRIIQAKKLGIPTIMLPEANREDCPTKPGIETIFIKNLREAVDAVF